MSTTLLVASLRAYRLPPILQSSNLRSSDPALRYTLQKYIDFLNETRTMTVRNKLAEVKAFNDILKICDKDICVSLNEADKHLRKECFYNKAALSCFAAFGAGLICIIACNPMSILIPLEIVTTVSPFLSIITAFTSDYYRGKRESIESLHLALIAAHEKCELKVVEGRVLSYHE